jgi:hypothetical protein
VTSTISGGGVVGKRRAPTLRNLSASPGQALALVFRSLPGAAVVRLQDLAEGTCGRVLPQRVLGLQLADSLSSSLESGTVACGFDQCSLAYIC